MSSTIKRFVKTDGYGAYLDVPDDENDYVTLNRINGKYYYRIRGEAVDTFSELEEVLFGKAEWVRMRFNKYSCSNCNNSTNVDESMGVPMYLYCPYCGFGMKGSINP